MPNVVGDDLGERAGGALAVQQSPKVVTRRRPPRRPTPCSASRRRPNQPVGAERHDHADRRQGARTPSRSRAWSATHHRPQCSTLSAAGLNVIQVPTTVRQSGQVGSSSSSSRPRNSVVKKGVGRDDHGRAVRRPATGGPPAPATRNRADRRHHVPRRRPRARRPRPPPPRPRLERLDRIAVLGGGRSSEHEVSLASAASVAAGLREARARGARGRGRP